jgi:nucleoside-diphosphate-sugar epimerase
MKNFPTASRGSMVLPKTVTLIGATGFIGRRFAEILIARGHEVVAPVRARSNRREGLPPELKIRQCSLSSEDEGLRDALGMADAVIYVAGTVRGSSIDDFRAANVRGVEVVADFLANLPPPVPPLLLISSLAASEPQLSDYARSKQEGERVLEARPELASTIFRPPAVYGPRDREMRPVFEAMRRGFALRAGPVGQRLSLLHADDLARAALAWLDAGAVQGSGLFELHDGCEGGYSLEEIAEVVACGGRVRILPLPVAVLAGIARMNSGLARLTGRAPMLSPGKVRELRHARWVCDNAAVTRALGWTPEIPLQLGIAELFR